VNNNIRIVIVGAGNIAEEHIKAFSAQNSCDIVGIFSRTKSKAVRIADKYKISNVADSIQGLAELSPDAVVIAVSVESTEAICLQAIKYPWIILVEKPVGLNYHSANLILENSIKFKSKLFVALNRRHYSSTLNAINILSCDSNNRFVTVNDQEDPILQIKSGMAPDLVKNLMYTNSIHLIDYFSIFCRGQIEKIDIAESWNRGESNIVTANIKFDSGDRGLYVALWDMPAPWSVSVVTKSINILMKPLEHIYIQEYGSRTNEKIEISQYDLSFKPGFFVQAQNLIKAVKGEKHNLASMKEVIKTMKLIKDLYEI
jgi:predicted dehydrogenase